MAPDDDAGPPDDVVVRASANVIVREVDGETVLYESTGQQVLVLDRVATVVWSLLAGGISLTVLCSRLASRFDVPVARVARDIAAPLADLVGARAVTVLPVRTGDESPTGV